MGAGAAALIPSVVLERRADLEGDLAPGFHPVQLVGDPGQGLGIVAEQERRLLGSSDDAVLALADDHQAAVTWQRGPETIGTRMNGQLPKLARRGLHPEPGMGDLGDEPRVASLGLLAEIHLGRPARLRLRTDPDEEEMCASLRGRADHDQDRNHRPEADSQSPTNLHLATHDFSPS